MGKKHSPTCEMRCTACHKRQTALSALVSQYATAKKKLDAEREAHAKANRRHTTASYGEASLHALRLALQIADTALEHES